MPPLTSQRIYLLCIPAAILLVFIFSALRAGSVTAPIKSLKDSAKNAGHSINENICTNDHPDFGKQTFGDTVAALYKPIKLPVTAKSYTDQRGKTFDNNGNEYWQRSLGSDILVVDIDTRNPNGKNEIFNPDKINWEKVESVGGGLLTTSFLNHFLYSQIHGYDYKYFNARPIDGHYNTWIKPHVVNEMLHHYKFIVFIDADAIIQHLEVPMEFLFNRWNITSKTSIAMPIDTRQTVNGDENTSMDSKGKVVLNSGVIVAQSLPYTFEMLNAWKTCTNELRYPGCGQWKQAWSHEQRAFSEYIRYDFNEDNNIVEIPCDEANGYPGLKGQNGVRDDCQGQFVRHHTLDKSMAKSSTTDVLMQSMAEVMQKAFAKNKEGFFIEEAEEHRRQPPWN